ncbi:hypothetical protein [Sulfuricystis multivorans]|uniref:hypothetical protein n=1 Tax=Sulfuricystis multivorans TaxID=2211108 RepID=UPI001558DFD5|nr:hypothetical protein [Sulfuricystis multivorans]
MRLAFLILLFANIVLFLWGQGYAGSQEAGREPARLMQQLAPEKLSVAKRE